MQRLGERQHDLALWERWHCKAMTERVFFFNYSKYAFARRAAWLMQSRSWSRVSNFLLGLR